MRRPTTLVIALGALLVLFGAACTSGAATSGATPSPTSEPTATVTPDATATPDVTPTPDPDDVPTDGGPAQPPMVAVNTGRTAGVFGTGTYCWTSGSGSDVVGICADTVGIIAEPIALEAGSGAVLELTGDLDWLGASHIAVAAWPRPATTVASGADWVAYRPEGDATALAVAPAANGARVLADLAPGRYLLHLTIAEERGDASYGLLLDIAGDAPAAGGVVVDDPVAMRIGEQIVVMGTPWTLEFTGVVGDSRCPTDVTCVWAGEVTLAFLASMEASARELEVTLGPQGEPVTALDDEYLLRILAVTPQPQADVEIEPGAYSALIVVERARVAAAGSGVQGVVTVGPQCPVQRADMSCPDRPYAAEMVIRDGAGNEVKRVAASDDGWFEVELAAGVWVLDPLSPAGSPLPVSEPVEFTVEPDTWTVLDVSYDSGIR